MLVHADLSDGNVLQRGGHLHAVIDFSCFGAGEPANDLDPAWGMFSGANRDAFRDALAPDDATWAREEAAYRATWAKHYGGRAG